MSLPILNSGVISYLHICMFTEVIFEVVFSISYTNWKHNKQGKLYFVIRYCPSLEIIEGMEAICLS